MTSKSELQPLESECTTVGDWVNLARRALEDPADQDYARELANNAEMDCQDPSDYVALAELFVHDLNDSEYAADLLEQAEDACFEPMEYAEVGGAYASLTDDKEKGVSLIREATQSATGGDLIKLADYASKAGEDELAASLLGQITGDLKELGQFLKLARELADSGNAEAAKGIVKSAQRYVQSVADTVSLAAASVELFDDQDQARELLESAEMDCQFPADYTALAKGFVEILGEQDRVDDLLAEATDIAMEGSEFLDLAYGYMSLKNDSQSALENFRQAIPDISDRSVLQEVAKTVATQLEDADLARECYKKISDKTTSPGDLVKLAVESWETLKDAEYTKKLFAEAKEKIANASDLVALAESVAQTLNDKELVSSIYRDAGAQVDSFPGLERIQASQRNTIEDASLTLALVERMCELATSSTELIKTFNVAQSVSQESDYCRAILSSAEDLAEGPADLEAVISVVQEFFSEDEAWLSNLTDKLSRRKANQAKYAEIQAQEKKADSALVLLRLAKRVAVELDDSLYARKLIDEALEGLAEQSFDVSLWLMAIEIAAQDLQDFDLVKSMSFAASAACTHFSSNYILLQKLRELLDDPHHSELTRQILSDWESRMSTATDSIKLAKAVMNFCDDVGWVGRIIDSVDTTDLNLLQLVELGDTAALSGDNSKAENFYEAASAQCESASDLAKLMNRLRTGGTSEDNRKSIYQMGGDKLSDVLEQLQWTEGILLHFNDRVWAKAEYDKLDSAIPDGALRSAYLASRRQRLQKQYF